VRLMRCLCAIALALSVNGCGTVCNLARGFDHPDTEPRIYGGVALDMDTISKVLNAPAAESEIDMPRTWALLLACGAIDPVFSLVGDTLTLPITVPLQSKRQAASEKKNQAALNAPLPSEPRTDSVPRVEALPATESNDNKGP
jgi:uncharacterized protein YceK